MLPLTRNREPIILYAVTSNLITLPYIRSQRYFRRKIRIMSKSNEEIYQEFKDAVNMAPKEIEDWLKTDKAQSVGIDSGDGKSKGYKSGKKIINIKNKKKADLSDADYDHMNKVVGYIHRHNAQKPKSDLKNSDWRYSLKNWGHDPCKEVDCD